MDTNQLANELNKYLNKHTNDPNFWSRDVIGIKIRKFCEGRGNFKKAPRGNPRKGYNTMLSNTNTGE